MGVFTQGQHTTFKVSGAGTKVLRIPGLKAGTLYACLVQGTFGMRQTSVVSANTVGSGIALLKTVSAEGQAIEDAITAELGVTGHKSYFVAGGDAALTRFIPTASVNAEASTATSLCMRVSAQGFDVATVDSSIAGILCRVSRDLGQTWGEAQEVVTPYPNGLNYAVFNINVPYESQVYVLFHTRFKDGSLSRPCHPYFLRGSIRPAATPLTAPTINSVSGAYSCTPAGVVSLSVTVTATADPSATDVLVQLLNGTTILASQLVSNTANTAVPVTIQNVDAGVTTYTVNAFSVKEGVRGAVTSTTWNTSSATPYTPAKFTPVSSILLSEKIERIDGALVSKIRVVFKSLITVSQPQGAIYIRRKDATPVGNLLKSNFTKSGVAAGEFVTDKITDAGAAVVYQVIVLAVGPNGAEADFSTDQIQEVNVFQYANYVPPQQTVPTVTLKVTNNVVSAVITGTYTQDINTPCPIEIRAYSNSSESDATTGTLVLKALYGSSSSGVYPYTLTIPDITPFSVGSGKYDISLRTMLENNGLTATAAKTTVRVIQALPGVPTWGTPAPAAYVKTIRGTINNAAAASIGSFSSYTPVAGGNGTNATLTAAANTLKVEVADATADPGSGNAGTNAEIVEPSVDLQGANAYLVVSPSNNTGSRNVRAKWVTIWGDTGWSAIRAVTFAQDTVVDLTAPTMANVQPRFTCNSDGSVSLTWGAANFSANSGQGSYIVRRGTSSSVGSSMQIALLAPGTLAWTDLVEIDKIGTTYYYWIDAISGQGILSGSAQPAKLQSANSYAVETVVAAVTQDSAPATVVGLVVKGSQGGFDISWTPNSERDIRDYLLEFSALGTFADTVSIYIDGSSYFQTLGATAAKATADVYRWRIKARDFKPQLSASYSSVATPDNTNYGSVADTAPNAPQSITLTSNNDGSITVAITAPASLPGVYYRVVRRYKTAAGWTETDGAAIVENDDVISATSTSYVDSGLKAGRWYNYRVYSQSKLGTLSASYAAAATPVAATDTTAPTAPTIATNPQYGVTGVTITPAEANGTLELWMNSGGTWNAGTATKIADAVVGPTAQAVVLPVDELDSANPTTKTYAARHIDTWGNTSSWSSPLTATALNWLRADMIDTVNLKAGSIATDRLQVGAVRLKSVAANGHFGSTSTYGDSYVGWTLGSGVTFTSQGSTYTLPDTSTLPVAKFTAAITSGVMCEQTMNVIPGATYTLVGIVYNDGAGASKPTVSLRIMRPDGTTRISGSSNASAGSVIPSFYKGSGITAAQTNNSDTTTGTTSAWKLIAYKFTVPTGVSQVRLQCAVESYAGGGNAYVSPSFIQVYQDNLTEAGSADLVSQLQAVSFGGDVQGNYSAVSVQQIRGKSVSSTAPTDTQVLSWVQSASQYQPKTIAQILGFTPINKAGDTGIGALTLTGALTAPSLTATGVLIGTAGQASVVSDAAQGFLLRAKTGTLYDFALSNPGNSAYIMTVPTGTTNSVFNGEVTSTKFNGSGAGLISSTVPIASLVFPGGTTSFLRADGSFTPVDTTTTITSGITLDGTYNNILVDSTSGSVTVLGQASPPNNFRVTIKKVAGTNSVVVGGNGKLIDGKASYTIDALWDSVTMLFSNNTWNIL